MRLIHDLHSNTFNLYHIHHKCKHSIYRYDEKEINIPFTYAITPINPNDSIWTNIHN